MRCLLQRVNHASVTVGTNQIASIQNGILVLLGVHRNDTEDSIPKMIEKIVNLRIFPSDHTHADSMEKSLLDVGGQLLVVSQFTLYADCRKGRRPGFSDAAVAEKAKVFYEKFIETCRAKNIPVEIGQFQAYMKVLLENDGPVTIWLEMPENTPVL